MKSFILWDHDGVLVDTEYWYFRATLKAMNEIGVNFNVDTYLQFMSRGQSLWDLAKRKNISDENIQEQKDKRNTYYQSSLVTEDIEIEGVENVLEQLAANYTMVIVTSARREDFELIHSNRNIVNHMKFVLTIENYSNCKPEPDPYLTALQRLGASKKNAVVIEDSERGLRSAISAGIDCIVIENAFTKSQDFQGACAVLSSLREVPEQLAI